jgi:hypothetical protein
MNSVTSSAADPVTTSTFQQAADADTFSSAPASRWASCRSHNQKIQAARRVANGARRDRTRTAKPRRCSPTGPATTWADEKLPLQLSSGASDRVQQCCAIGVQCAKLGELNRSGQSADSPSADVMPLSAHPDAQRVQLFQRLPQRVPGRLPRVPVAASGPAGSSKTTTCKCRSHFCASRSVTAGSRRLVRNRRPGGPAMPAGSHVRV